MSEAYRTWVKVCGITCPEDAELAALAGADAIGLNFVPSSKRYIDRESAERIRHAVAGRVEIVGVVADVSLEFAEELRLALGLDWLQLHGLESPEFVAKLPRAFKAVGIASAADVERARDYPGERLLVDAKRPGELGGTGATFDWSLVVKLARARPLIVAGGLDPANVGAAIERVRPYGVDASSGLERDGDPRRKDPEKVQEFVRAARKAC